MNKPQGTCTHFAQLSRCSHPGTWLFFYPVLSFSQQVKSHKVSGLVLGWSPQKIELTVTEQLEKGKTQAGTCMPLVLSWLLYVAPNMVEHFVWTSPVGSQFHHNNCQEILRPNLCQSPKITCIYLAIYSTIINIYSWSNACCSSRGPSDSFPLSFIIFHHCFSQASGKTESANSLEADTLQKTIRKYNFGGKDWILPWCNHCWLHGNCSKEEFGTFCSSSRNETYPLDLKFLI